MIVLRIYADATWKSERLHFTLAGKIVIEIAGEDLVIVAAENNFLYVPRASVKSLEAYTWRI